MVLEARQNAARALGEVTREEVVFSYPALSQHESYSKIAIVEGTFACSGLY